MVSDIKTIKREPWIDLNLRKSKNFTVKYNQTHRHREKYCFFQNAYDFLSVNSIEGSYFEFGVHKARTFRFALRESIIKNLNQNFYAFDSFEGLPYVKNYKKQNKFFYGGKLKTSKKKFLQLVNTYKKYRKINVVEGWYENTLDEKLIKKFKKNKVKAGLINIDCDLVESVKQSLNFSTNFVGNGTILYIDDYYTTYKGDPRKGIPKAVRDILKKKKIYCEPWHLVGTFSKSFILYL